MKRHRISLLLLAIGVLSAAARAEEWSRTGAMVSVRGGHTATLLLTGNVLVAGGQGANGRTSSAELYDPGTGAWTLTGSLHRDRENHSATLLASGKVLVVGGTADYPDVGLSSAELYDPETGRWTRTDALERPRVFHTATLLASGKVLVVGGSGAPSSAEIYDPGDGPLGSWSPITAPEAPRSRHTATLLRSGKVLVVGGSDAPREAELYDSETGEWELLTDPGDPADTDVLNDSRQRHTATLLPSGEVLVAGDDFTGGFSAELYDPDQGTWTLTTDGLNDFRWNHSATLLPSGKVLLVGTSEAIDSATAELYDPVTGLWEPTASLNDHRSLHTATLLPSGKVLVAGSRGGLDIPPLASAELFDVDSGDWFDTTPPERDRSGHTATLLPGGEVLVVLGTSAESYDPDTETWTLLAGPEEVRFGHTATLLPSGQVLVVAHSSAELYDDGTWTLTTGSPRGSRFLHSATLLPSGKVLVIGGCESGSSAELYDPESGTWTFTSPPDFRRGLHTATLLPSGKVLVAGGTGGDCYYTPVTLSSVFLYDPDSDTWAPTGRLHEARSGHTATLLPSGRVLVAGGAASAELYDPATGTWTETGAPTGNRLGTATLLPSGEVLLVHAGDARAELYDPATGTWTETGPPIATVRNRSHTATLLPSGDVLVASGSSARVYRPLAGRRPVITSAPRAISHGELMALSGTGFRGNSEGSGGTTLSSAVNYPLIHLLAVEGGRSSWLLADPPQALVIEPPPNIWDDEMTLEISRLPPTFDPGHYLLTVVAAGVPSRSRLVQFDCSVAVTDPADQEVAVGSSATFTVELRGKGTIRWQQCVGDAEQCSAEASGWLDIEGVSEESYATPPIGGPESGTKYRAVAHSVCLSDESCPASGQLCPSRAVSAPATLTVTDDEDPTAAVLSPGGGELWLLSAPGASSPNVETITWTMEDDIRICRVEVSLLVSTDSGETYLPLASSELPSTFGDGGACIHPGETVTTTAYTMPDVAPSGTEGSLYKVRVEVTDHAGNTATVESPNPFFMVERDDSVRTLILVNSARMEAQGLFDDPEGLTTADLDTKLLELAGQQRVAGAVVDLSGSTALENLYALWDADPGDAQKANDVLFGSGGVHDVIRDNLAAFPEVKDLVLVGDDRIVPMARVPDATALLPESSYPTAELGDPNLDLTSGGTTVGQALAQGFYLSDDPLALRQEVRTDELPGALFLPDLGIGRLVETPAEIVKTISTYISKGGILDLEDLDPGTGHKVLVTGYDFLADSATRVRERWKNVLCEDPDVDSDLEPVDGELIDPPVSWSEDQLKTHLCGNGGDPYAVLSLNGHATHYQVGVPGTGPFDIQGLDAEDIVGAGLCGGETLDLAGVVAYAVGCHGGLPVAGSEAAEDHPLDLPQALMSRGVVAYVANSGYGWGLKAGSGYSERLIEIFTDELTRTGTVVVGDAVRHSKERYKMEGIQTDPYDVKSSMQWTLFGLPMYAVKTGITPCGDAAGAAAAPAKLAGAPRAGELPAAEELGGVRVSRRASGALSGAGGRLKAAPPRFVTRLDLQFDFTAEDLFVKRGASGNLVDAAGCPAQEDGCYYTLNGLATGVTDLPIQPYFVFDSRLSGTSQHGVLWKGGVYDEERGWKPVIGELQSNGGDGSNHGVAPRHMILRPAAQRIARGEDPQTCRPSDLELNSLVLPAGEALKDREADAVYDIQRTYRRADLEIFYYNNTFDGSGNCDRGGPSGLRQGAGPFAGNYHRVTGTAVSWQVPVEDDAGVWRVLVVYNDGTTETVGGVEQGAWAPLELADDGTGTWRGSLPIGGVTRLTYVIQAVDNHGNVSWLDFVTDQMPSSGVELEVPLPVDVVPADLEVALSDAPDPVTGLEALFYTIEVRNLGPGPTTSVVVSDTLPAGVTYVVAEGEDWDCRESSGVVTCTRSDLETGAAPPITLMVLAPPSGTLVNTVSVASDADPEPGNDTTTEQTTVITVPAANLSVRNMADHVMALPGEPLSYTIEVRNHGPDPVAGATVSDDFAPALGHVLWACLSSGGALCTASGSGLISDSVDLPVGGLATYLAVGILNPAATVSIVNTATVTTPLGVVELDPGDNSSSVSTPVGPDVIFADDFESEDVSVWSSSTEGRD